MIIAGGNNINYRTEINFIKTLYLAVTISRNGIFSPFFELCKVTFIIHNKFQPNKKYRLLYTEFFTAKQPVWQK